MRRLNFGTTTILFFTLLLFLGCSLASRKREIGREINVVKELPEGKGDAYLYDLKIYREGKKNSVRLDVYWNQDSVSFFARGYLGKGVLKGMVTDSSVLAYFPTEEQYYKGTIDSLINDGCFGELAFERMLIDLFGTTPDKLEYSYVDFFLVILKNEPDKKEFRLTSKVCPEQIELEYDVKQDRFLLEKAVYSVNDDSFKLIAERRKYRLNIDIPGEKFRIDIPQTAARIYP